MTTAASVAATPSVSGEQRATPTPRVATVTVTARLTNSPTAAPSVTKNSILPSTTPVGPTAPPFPTLSSGEGETLLRSLMQADDDCRLPCWWGIQPGVTKWQDVEPFLESFASEIHRSANRQGSVVSYEIYFYYPNREQPSTRHGAFYHLNDGVVTSIELNVSDSLNWSSTYTLPAILRDYGTPTEVWIGTYDNTPSGERPFRMTVIYSGKGLVVSYETRNVKREGEAIVGCPLEPAPLAFLWLVEEGSSILFEEVRSRTLHVGDDQLYLPLEEATDLAIEDFYKLFTESTGTQCLSTPAKLWPY